jgi:glyoxylase-like metal-dependent hydrolase (beta-lactamase superfamily II)
MIGDTYRFKVGDFDCIIFCDIEELFPASQIISSIPREEIEGELGSHGYDPTNIDFSMNLLYIQTPDGRALVDTGLQRKQDLPASLKAAGIAPESIDHVILTHSDGDHIGGVAYSDGKLTYLNAHYAMSKGAWEHGMAEAQKTEDPNLVARRSLSAIQDRVDLVAGDTEVLPGIRVLPAPGHKPGHIAVLIESRGERLLHLVDAAHHPIQVIHPDWSPNADVQPDVAAQTRRALFERAADENLLVMAYHFPFPGVGHVVRQNNQLRWQPIIR